LRNRRGTFARQNHFPGSSNMLSEFREFIARGNVIDLAVGVNIGGAFATITGSLTEDLIMPIVGWIFGGVDFSSQFILLGSVPDGIAATDYAALKKAGVAMVGYGAFITAVINFLILAWIIFLLVKMVNRVIRKATDAPAGPTEVDLLAEIRDELRKT
jgi:large conductance mechanosensitive channel